jgi:hypothetical protein
VENEILIAAGCGDKHLYFFTLEGKPYQKLFVDSKIHSIVSDQSSSKLYCTSDAKKIYEVGWQGISYGIIDKKDLPHRATKLAFIDEEFRKIAVVCEDSNIYVFDSDEREIISLIRVGQRIFSVKDASWHNTNLLLIGQAHGRLSCIMYSPAPEKFEQDTKQVKGFLRDFNPSSFASLAELVLFGPKSQSVEVGIGRFLHITPASIYGRAVCIVGTDGGDVAVIVLSEDAKGQILYKTDNNKGAYRVWAVYGYWERKGQLRLFFATSERRVLQFVLHEAEPPSLTEEEHIDLNDWPREIRPVDLIEPGEKRQLLISCENGDLIIYGNGDLKFNAGQILRTGYARQVSDGEYDIVTGSDNNFITFFRNQAYIWHKETLDKVREVLITKDECIAVSEDRYLYVLNHEGRLKFRYRFPHRALCVDLYFDHKKIVWFVVGCGDGYVYFVNQHGYVREAYEFPDRIRDVKIFNNEEVIIACEDRQVYLAPTIDKLIKESYSDKHLELIENEIKELKRRIRGEGLIAISNLSEDERLLLLMYANEWFRPANVDVIVSLLDASKQAVFERDNLKLYYIYASALIVLTIKGDFAAGKTRIEDYINLNKNNSYALHSMLATVTHNRIKSWTVSDRSPSPLVTIDTIITHLPFDDPWILEECVRHLYHAGFFSFSRGFCHFFDTVQINYNKLSQIIDCALDCSHTPIYKLPMVRLVKFLRERKVDFQKFADIFDNLPANSDVEIKECLDELHFVMNANEEPDVILTNLKDWVEKKIINEGMRSICKNSINDCFTSATSRYVQYNLVAELMESRLFRLNCILSARDYLYILFCCSFMWILSDRFDGKSNST